jgi:uncharacterized Zn finger protein (UPF0148 family)
MKQLTCEMCGSTELIKQDGFFVCQTCGCKYSVEEAKKMMIEGTVDVQGTVKVDNSAFVEKYLANARRAKQKEDWEETEKYYNMVEQNDPTNIEAIFYSSYGKAKRSLVDADIYKRQAAFKVLQNCVSIIDDNFDIEKEAEQKAIISQINSDIFAMAGSSYVYNQKTNQYGVVTWTDKSQTEALFISLIDEFITTLNNIADKYPSEIKINSVDFLKAMIKCHEFQNRHMGLTKYAQNIRKDTIHSLHVRINAIDPTHEVPENEVPKHTVSPSINTPLGGSSIWNKLLIIGMSVLAFGAFMFINLEEEMYFARYLRLDGYVSSVNMLFILDYICIILGAIGIFVNANSKGTKVSTATILGLVGFVFSWIIAIVGHIVSIIGIVLGAKEAKESNNKFGLYVCIIAEICAVLSSALGILIMAR